MSDLRDGVCPTCQHPEVLRSPAFDRDDTGFQPAGVAYESRTALGGIVFTGTVVHGRLWMYVCRRCGYVQWFAEQPESIPLDPSKGVTLVPRRAGR